MAQKFKEVAHLRTDMNKYSEGYERIFGGKEKTTLEKFEEENPEEVERAYWKHVKDLARKAYRDQQTQDNEGGCGDAGSFITGFMAGYRERIKLESNDNEYEGPEALISKKAMKRIYGLNKLRPTKKDETDDC